ncbi:MAG: alpha-amylase family glycosyl hydrolase [Desulfobacterales bacterium]
MITQEDVIYFVVTDRFRNGDLRNDFNCDPDNPEAFHGGDFAGLLHKIPYFKTLGVTAVWLTPVYLNITDFFSSSGYHGYWAVDFERIDPHLYSDDSLRAAGSRAYFRDLVNTFHDAGLKVILDMVVNHTGYHTPEYENYPHKRFESGHFNRDEPGDVTEAWLSGLPDLDHDQPEVADYFVQNVLDWIEDCAIDGIRMDTVKHVEDTFWYLFKSQVKTRHPQVTLIGEVLDWRADFIGRYQQEHDFDTLFDFPLCGALKGAFIWDQPLTTLARPRLAPDEPKGVLDINKPYTNANRLVTLLDNHDLDQRITTEILDRVGHWDRDLAGKILKLCLSFLFTTRGIPQIYYGTEIGLAGGKDPDNRRDMPWELFTVDHMPAADHGFETDIYRHLRRLIRLRAQHLALTHGYLFTLYVDSLVYVYLREFRGDLALVAINNGYEEMPLPLPVPIAVNANLPPRIKALFSGGTVLTRALEDPADLVAAEGRIWVQLPGKSAAIFTG